MKKRLTISLILPFVINGCAFKYNSQYKEYIPTEDATVFNSASQLTPELKRLIQAHQFSDKDSSEHLSALKSLDFGNYNGTLSDAEKQQMNGIWLDFYASQNARSSQSRSDSEVCVALSGGGIRSAAYAFGVLQGINEKYPIDKMRAISGVSGGAYAISSLYAAALRGDKSLSTALKGEEEKLLKISKNPKFVSERDVAAIVTKLGTMVPFSVASTNFNKGWTFGAGTLEYERLIEKFWLGGSFIRWNKWQSFLAENNLPTPIFSTAAIPKLNPTIDRTLAQLTFEITPYMRGNFSMGYTDIFLREGLGGVGQNYLTVTDVVASSAAAIDSPKSLSNESTTNFGFRLAATEDFLGAPLMRSALTDFKKQFQPERSVAVYPRDYQSPLQNKKIFHTDGGYADNLAAYPLIRRGCKTIIVIDAEHDPEQKFCALSNLMHDLGTNHAITAIQNDESKNLSPSERRALFESNKNNDACKAPYDSQQFFTSKSFSEVKFKARQKPTSHFSFNLTPWTAVKPQKNGTEPSPIKIEQKVLYIKLARPDKFESISTDEAVKIERYEADCLKVQAPCQFPHDVTRTQTYTPDQYQAYQLLGRNAGRSAVRSDFKN